MIEQFKQGIRELEVYGKLENGLLLYQSDHVSEIEKKGREVIIRYQTTTDFFRLFSLYLANQSKDQFYFSQQKKFTRMALVVDNSRGAVMNVDALKELIRIMAVLGFTELQLYTEDTFEVPGEPYFGYLRGRYLISELKEVDRYAQLFGIELVPCIQTLAHLERIFRWKTYWQDAMDVPGILMAKSERALQLIEHIFSALSDAFTSRRVNIGMDEAFMLGRGTYHDRFGCHPQSELFFGHLESVVSIARKHHFQVEIWADMVLKYRQDARGLDGIRLIYWDYGNCFAEYRKNLEKGRYLEGFQNCLQLTGQRPAFAGGAWKFVGFTPDNRYSLPIAETALNACEEAGITEVLLTMWGDNGNETPVFSALPVMCYYAARAYGGMQIDENVFSLITGVALEDFLSIDCASRLSNNDDPGEFNNSSKFLLYNDLFLGSMDETVRGLDIRRIYAGHMDMLGKVIAQNPRHRYLFETQRALCEVLMLKADLGLRIRDAYRSGERTGLAEATNDLELMKQKIGNLYQIFKKQWFTVNKPFGIEVADARFGSLRQRAESCIERLSQYLSGHISVIPELEETILNEYTDNKKIIMQSWAELTSPNNLY